MQPAPQDYQLMSKHRVLSFKPQLRLEWRSQDGQNETEQSDHSASLGDSITSLTRMRFRYTQEGIRRSRLVVARLGTIKAKTTHRALSPGRPGQTLRCDLLCRSLLPLELLKEVASSIISRHVSELRLPIGLSGRAHGYRCEAAAQNVATGARRAV
jgi:hypothetical protein